MKRLLTILLLLISFAGFSQTNATFNNLDVRNKSTFRGYHYIYDSTFFKPTGTNIPWWDLTDTLGFVLSVSNPNESQLVKVRLSTLLDSLGISGGADSLYIVFGCYSNIDTWLYNSDTIYIDTCINLNDLGDVDLTIPDSGDILRFDDNTNLWVNVPLPQTDSVSYADTAGYAPQYWTFVNSGTDTLKNNVSTAGVVAIKGNLELETTNTGATEGVVKQNGGNLMHTYHEKGDNNLFIGQGAGNFTQDSSFNIGIGKATLVSQTTGRYNIAIGENSLHDNTGGYSNVAIGYNALYTNAISHTSVAIGYEAMRYANSTASFNPTFNTAIGYAALKGSNNPANNTGTGNTAIGYTVLQNNTSGDNNVNIGSTSGQTNTIGSRNTFVGGKAGSANIEGLNNVGIGYQALFSNQDNDGTTAVGYNCMLYSDSRNTSERVTYNTAVGFEAMRGSTTAANNIGQYNTATGYQALDGMTSGSFNTVYGYDAGGGITTGDSNILIGTSAGAQLTTESDRLFIDNTNTTTPLVWGNMRTDSLIINGDMVVTNDSYVNKTIYEQDPNHFFVNYIVTGADTIGGASAGTDIAIATRWIWTKVALGFTDTESDGFDLIATDTIKYTGWDGTSCDIKFEISMSASGGLDEDWEMAIWNVTDNAIVTTRTARTTSGSANIIGLTIIAYDHEADQNDKYVLKVRNLTNTDDLTVFYVSWFGYVFHY